MHKILLIASLGFIAFTACNSPVPEKDMHPEDKFHKF